jgi:putative ATP-grasp target RiPP
MAIPTARSTAGPLSSIEVRTARSATSDEDATNPTTGRSSTPLALRALRPAPDRAIPDHAFDPVRQVAVGLGGLPLAPQLGKDWTTVEGTHTDGDGGDNEMWGWEEN